MNARNAFGLRDKDQRDKDQPATMSRTAFVLVVVAANLTWLLAGALEWSVASSTLATMAVLITGLVVGSRRAGQSFSTGE